MKIENTTDFPDYFLRRMVSWCCRQLGLRVRDVSRIRFRNRNDGFASGHCYVSTGRICVSVPGAVTPAVNEIHDKQYARWDESSEYGREKLREIAQYADPVYVHACNGGSLQMCERSDSDRVSTEMQEHRQRHRESELVRVTAHELAHRWLWLQGSRTRRSRRYGTTSGGGSERQTRRHEQWVFDEFEKSRDRLMAEWMKPPRRQLASKPSLRQQRAAKVDKKLAEWQRKFNTAKRKVAEYKRKKRYYDRVCCNSVSPKTPNPLE